MNSKIRILITKIIFHLVMNNPFFTSRLRRIVLVVCGAKIGKGSFIGQNVYLDPLAIQNISIGNHCLITQNVSILTHFYGINRNFYFDKVEIGNNVFIGMNSIICKPVRIGNNSIICAGSVITKDIPEGVLAGGVPCKIIKKL